MIEIKFHGRGGQGVVVTSEILARACFKQGMYPQYFSAKQEKAHGILY
jgi:Pyruvate/2-oxoacid:ferredoxin oxidoreductase gamma subunit